MLLFDVLRLIASVVITVVIAVNPIIALLRTPQSEIRHPTSVIATISEQGSAIPSLFKAFSEIIRVRLRTDSRYQQAAVAGVRVTPPTVSKTSIEEALVNVFCTAQGKNGLRTVTGSGIFIDERGIILTNAHIAQFLLISEDATAARCVIRQGNPATEKYEADLLYVSPVWITTNAYQFSALRPSGTGEHDFALLYVVSALNGELPSTFPSLSPIPTGYFFDHMDVRAAGYPAEMLTAEYTDAPLIPSVASTSVTQLFTFGGGEIDLISIAPSVVGQQGSSGGPIVQSDGGVIGLIVTRGNMREEGAQSLRALTLSYIDRTLTEETGLDLAHTLAGDIHLRAKVFRETVTPYLRALLLETL